MTPGYISQIENNFYLPSARIIAKLARAYGVDELKLLREAGILTPPLEITQEALLSANAPPAYPGYISVERYVGLLQAMLAQVRVMADRPDSFVGTVRSGLFPAVFLSQQLDLPMFTGSDARSFPYPRLNRPLVVDTVAWTGGSVRRIVRRLEKCGVESVPVLVMFARAEPLPQVAGLTYLETAQGIPRFWYDEPLKPEGR